MCKTIRLLMENVEFITFQAILIAAHIFRSFYTAFGALEESELAILTTY